MNGTKRSHGGAESAVKKAKFVLPTSDEQMQIQQSSLLANSNFLRLQVEEMLQSIQPDDSFEKKAPDWRKRFTDRVSSVSRDVALCSRKSIEKAGIQSDALSAYFESNDKLPALNIQSIGSHATDTMTAPFLNLDFLCFAPDVFFGQNDLSANGSKYFYKREYFVTCLLSFLKRPEFDDLIKQDTLTLALFKGDLDKHVLIFEPKGVKNATVRVYPAASASLFKVSRLRVKNCSRGSNEERVAAEVAADRAQSIAEDLAVLSQHRLLAKTMQMFPAAKGVLKLLKVWLTQRSMRHGLHTLDGHSAALLVAYMYASKRLWASAEPLSAFHSLLNILAGWNDSQSGMTFAPPFTVDALPPQCEVVSLQHPVIGVDKSEVLQYNALWRVSKTSWRQLIEEAKRSVEVLQVDPEASFNELFMRKKSFFRRYDMYLTVPLRIEHVVGSGAYSTDDGEEDAGVYPSAHSAVHRNVSSVYTIICKALLDTDRVLAAHVSVDPADSKTDAKSSSKSSQWISSHAPCTAVSPKSNGKNGKGTTPSHNFLISIGLILDKANSHRRVDRSNEPASSDDATGGESAFKSFWGKKCELRRFQDGSIVEAVVWDLAPTSLGGSSNVPKGEFIVEQVVRYILGQHLANWAGERGERIINPQASLTASLARASYHGAGTVQKSDPRWRFDNETLTRKAVECVDNLRNLICSELKGPPLHVEALNSITDALRYTSVHPPMPHPFLMGADTIKEFSGVNVSLQTRPILLVGTLESSSKWPEDEDAFEHSLTGFIIAISDALRTQHQLETRVHRKFLDIFYEGHIFRIILHVSNRRSLPEVRSVCLDKMTGDTIYRDFDAAVAHHQAIRSVVSAHPSYAPAVRILASWMAGHGYTGSLPHEAIELLIASVYLNPDTQHAPSTPCAGFIHALKRLIEWDWGETPLVLNFGEQSAGASTMGVSKTDSTTTLPAGVKAELDQMHRTLVSEGKQSAMCIMSVYNHMPLRAIFPATLTSPEKPVLHMIIASAKTSLNMYLEQLETGAAVSQSGSSSVSKMLVDRGVYSKCNVILKIKEAYVVDSEIEKTPSPLSVKIFANLPVSELDPKKLIVRENPLPTPLQHEVIHTLTKTFGGFAIFFWNGLKGDEIGIMWRPRVFLTQNFSVMECSSRIVIPDDTNVGGSVAPTVVNVASILSDIIAACDGMVADISIR